MRGVLEYDLNEDKNDFIMSVHAFDAFKTLSNVDNYCRNQIKHGDISEELEKSLQAIRDMIWEEGLLNYIV